MTSNQDRKTKTINYRFLFPDGTTKNFSIALDYATLALVATVREPRPAWTRLKHHKCGNCPLDETVHPYCPIAANLVDIVDFFSSSMSYEEVEVFIDTEPRTYSKKVPLQRVLSSLYGICMVTSGCPVMDKLRPMVDTHLPFATADETMYRTITMYLLAQFFCTKNGKAPDWKMNNLVSLLDEISEVDVDFSARLRSTDIKDASLNAVTILHTFGQSTLFTIEMNDLDRLEKIFRPYYE